MADSSDRGDNVTKLDKPLLSLKKPSAKAVTGRSKPILNKTRAGQNKPRAGSAKPTEKTTGAPALQSRQIVLDILTAVEEGSQLDKALAAHADLPKLDGRDRRFVQLLATTYLRRRGQLEKILAPLMTRRPFGAQTDANIILAMGAAQLLFLKTGAHAAVDSTVELMRQAGFERLCGLANAVMRRLTRDGDTLLATTHDAENLPEWLRLSWQHYWGDEATDMIAGLAMLPPSLDISVAADAAHWAEKLDGKLLHGNTIRREFDGYPYSNGHPWMRRAAVLFHPTFSPCWNWLS